MARATKFYGDPFGELGVAPTVSRDELRQAFRRRARETHPDHRPDDPDAARRFTRLRAAYEEALERLKSAAHGEHKQKRSTYADDPSERHTRRGRTLTEHELATRVQTMADPAALWRALLRHGHRPVIGAALARNPALPTDALPALRRSTEGHWTVDAAIADRGDVPYDLLLSIARLAREPIVGLAVVGNAKTDAEALDALVHGPIRLDASLENALSAHADLSVDAASRLAGRYATNPTAVVRLVDRGDLPEELLVRLAGQTARGHVASAARRDLIRRGVAPPPLRNHRSTKTLTGYWR